MRGKFGFFLSLASLALAASAWAGPAAAADADHLDCAYPFWIGFAPVHLANELGYFEAEGITVTETIDDDISNAYAAMERGDIDCYLRSVGEYQGRPRTPEMQGIIIGTIDISNGGDGIVADGSIKSICDLKGKTVASEPNLPSTLIVQMALKDKCGLTVDQINLMPIASADASAVFTDESVAAVGAYEPVLTQAVIANEGRGAHIIVSSRDYPGLITDAIIARTDNLRSQPEKYVKFLRAIYRAIDYFKANHDEAVEIMAPHFDLKPAEFEDVLKNIRYTDFQEATRFMGTPEKPGEIYKIFDEVMELNLENKAADIRLEAGQQIDSSIIAEVAKSYPQ